MKHVAWLCAITFNPTNSLNAFFKMDFSCIMYGYVSIAANTSDSYYPFVKEIHWQNQHDLPYFVC